MARRKKTTGAVEKEMAAEMMRILERKLVEHGVSQVELAVFAACDQPRISKLLDGKLVPTLPLASRLMNAFVAALNYKLTTPVTV